jgi:hypothetical protein
LQTGLSRLGESIQHPAGNVVTIVAWMRHPLGPCFDTTLAELVLLTALRKEIKNDLLLSSLQTILPV